jgi:hypothetical protein
MAFEALKAQLYVQRAVGGEKPWSQRNFFWVTPGGEVTTHPLDGVTAGSELRTRDDPPWPADTDLMVKERRRLEIAMAGLFDPLTGVMTWDNDDIREFPLPHQRMVLCIARRDGAPQIISVVEWALTPQEAGLRTLLKAVARHAQTSLCGPQDPLVVAAGDLEHWNSLALAQAIARSEVFAERGRTAVVSPRGIADPDIQMLLRLTRLYCEELPVLRIFWIPGLPAFMAKVSVGSAVASAVAASATQALVECLGEALSRWQLAGENAPMADDRTAAKNSAPQADQIALSDLESPPVQLATLGYDARAHHLSIAALEGTGVVVGWIELFRNAP